MTATKQQREAFGEYLVEVRNAMWLGVWRIDVYWDGDLDSGGFAEIRPTYGQKHAQLRVCHDFFDMEPWKQRRIVVHELLHCHNSDVQELAERLRANLGDQAYEAWIIGFRLATEHMVDAVTTVLAHEDSDLIPLPSLPQSDQSV